VTSLDAAPVASNAGTNDSCWQTAEGNAELPIFAGNSFTANDIVASATDTTVRGECTKPTRAAAQLTAI
jgi:hypothetical protein